MAIIRSENIEKKFYKSKYSIYKPFSFGREEIPAVKGLSINIEEGEFVGFLGPNGAGKTTFLKILSGIIHPTGGTAKVMGHIPWERDYEYLSNMAIVMGQKNQLWWDLPAIDSFRMLKEIYSISEKEYKANLDLIVEVLGMQNILTKRLRGMSLGERMKCELAASFLHNPKVIFLDEPTIGLDIISSQAIRTFLKTINRKRKCTFILTSHYLGDIEELCERVVIINHGEMVYDGSLTKLKSKYAPEKIIKIHLADIEDRKKFANLAVERKRIEEGRGIIRVDKSRVGEIAKEIFDVFSIEDITISDPDTEEIIGEIFKRKG